MRIALLAVLAGCFWPTHVARASEILQLYNQYERPIEVFLKSASAKSWTTLQVQPKSQQGFLLLSQGTYEVVIRWARLGGDIIEYRGRVTRLKPPPEASRDFAVPLEVEMRPSRLFVLKGDKLEEQIFAKETIPCHWLGATYNSKHFLFVPQFGCEPDMVHTPTNPIPPRLTGLENDGQ